MSMLEPSLAILIGCSNVIVLLRRWIHWTSYGRYELPGSQRCKTHGSRDRTI